MIQIKKCNLIPKSAPELHMVEKSKSDKVIKMSSLWFFITDTKSSGSDIYSINMGIQIGWQQSKAHALNWTVSKLAELKKIISTEKIQISATLNRVAERNLESKKLSKIKATIVKLMKFTYLWSTEPHVNKFKPAFYKTPKRAKTAKLPESIDILDTED